jgi:hypothetical protein
MSSVVWLCQRRAWRVIAIFLAAISWSTLSSRLAYADCGYEDHELNSERDFADKYPGNLALQFGKNFLSCDATDARS